MTLTHNEFDGLHRNKNHISYVLSGQRSGLDIANDKWVKHFEGFSMSKNLKKNLSIYKVLYSH